MIKKLRQHANMHRLFYIFLIGMLLTIGGVFYMRRYSEKIADAAAQSVGVVQPANMWQTFPGATVNKDGSVHFDALNRLIVNQDGSGGQANPPVNVGGPHLEMKGDFKLAYDMSQLNGGDATVRLYRSVPVIYDEWRLEPVSLGVTISGPKLLVRVWDGKGEQPMLSRSFTINENVSHTLVLKREGQKMKILVDGKQVASLSIQKLFSSNKIWFGADGNGDGWTLDRFTLFGRVQPVTALSSSSIPEATSFGVLAAAARPAFKIGAAVSLYPLMADQAYRNIALNQFTQWTPENEMKAQFIHPSKDTYAFQDADLLVDTALKNNISVHGHALVFGEANAKWMQETPASELKSVMTDHITAIVGHFKGKVTEWDVVNEPLDDYEDTGDGFRQSIWYKAMGKSFIAEALKSAHAADPDAKLYINEYGLEENGERWTTFINLVKELKSSGIPLDGVGFQAHVYDDGDEIDAAVLRDHMQQLSSLGISSRISEIDVHGDDSALQAQQYGAIAGACRAEPTCTSFTTWGISDKYGSTTSDHTYPPEYGDDLLWDSRFRPKSALQSVLNALK